MKSGHKYVLLDGLRGVAALVVVVRHALSVKPFDPLPHGGLAVDFFFVLSGFVIAHAYERKLAEGGMSLLEFARIRLVRLYPLVALGATLALIALLAGQAGKGDLGALTRGCLYALGSFAFLPLPSGSMAPPDHLGDTVFLNSPEWSLCYEILINIIYAAVAVRLTDRRLMAAVAAGALWLLLQPLYLGRVSEDWTTFASGAARVLFSFGAGVLLFRLGQSKPVTEKTGSAALAALALVVCLCLPGRYGDLIGVALTLGAFPPIVWLASRARLTPRAAAAADWAGRLSFPVYILHFPLLQLVGGQLGRTLGPAARSPATLLIEIPLVVAISAVALVAFDQPVRAWLSRSRDPVGRWSRALPPTAPLA